ncbi:porin [Novosphingobium sp. KACC 22771]|uniref:porin n=1 Tax=Novosphingobium sp. KACC 22771 TaxID=3025670 RepID=UPI0023668433|nr:porin [Novosphingobium sp. KACC 22771]WDF73163.1 porin [Novosphingobium sp. KACC 22771]
MLWKVLLGTASAVAMMGVSTTAYAGNSQALLKRLHDKGILSDAEYNELLKDEAEAPAPAAAAPVVAGDTAKFVRATDSGIGLQVGPATIKFSGSVNGFYVYDNAAKPGANTAVTGGIASVGGNTSAVRNGLLPGFLKVDATTTQNGWDVGAHFGMYPGINSAAWGALGANNGGQPTALATAGIDFRETYLTIGRKGFGELKIGRAIGLFGSEAILNDITLLSSGPTGGNAAPANTTLGRIGSGYIYTDFQPQMTYTTPSMSGFQASVGVFQPLNSLTAGAQNNSSPGFQGKVTYDGAFDAVKLHLWASGITQEHKFVAGGSYTGQGLDVGARTSIGPVTLVGTYYTAKGLGTTVLNLFDTDAAGKPRSSEGYYLQAALTQGKFTVAGSYGASYLNHTDAADRAANPTLVRVNSSTVGQLRYGLNSWVTLIGEYINSKAKAHNGNSASSDAVALGGILFF